VENPWTPSNDQSKVLVTPASYRATVQDRDLPSTTVTFA